MGTLGLATRFVVAGAIGAVIVIGIGAAATPPAPNLLLPATADYNLTADTGDVPAQFSVVTDQAIAAPGASPSAAPVVPVVLQPLPDDAQITLVAYADGKVPDTGGPSVRPNWLSPVGFPRINPITQFDGGPLGGTNCTMASGAMLARLGFGIVTTGSQLRGAAAGPGGRHLAGRPRGGDRKFGVRFNRAPLSPLQLRALLYAGAGAVIQGTYGIIPFELRLQKNFTGGHAIYLDGFRPASADGPAAYYVIDPLGRPGRGLPGRVVAGRHRRGLRAGLRRRGDLHGVDLPRREDADVVPGAAARRLPERPLRAGRTPGPTPPPTPTLPRASRRARPRHRRRSRRPIPASRRRPPATAPRPRRTAAASGERSPRPGHHQRAAHGLRRDVATRLVPRRDHRGPARHAGRHSDPAAGLAGPGDRPAVRQPGRAGHDAGDLQGAAREPALPPVLERRRGFGQLSAPPRRSSRRC